MSKRREGPEGRFVARNSGGVGGHSAAMAPIAAKSGGLPRATRDARLRPPRTLDAREVPRVAGPKRRPAGRGREAQRSRARRARQGLRRLSDSGIEILARLEIP